MTHKARKRFGQNFLHDDNIIYSIIANAQPQKGEHWVEIGPGQGAITRPLLQKEVNLDVVELDRDLVSLLQNKLSAYSNLKIHSADALNFDFTQLAQENEKLRIIGNLPYNISTPLMFHLVESLTCIEDMHFMLQKEVVERLCAQPGSKKYGRLSVMMQYYCDNELLFDVPRECFDPIPKVTSAIVRLTPHSQPPVEIESIEKLNQIVTTAFSQRRKTIRNSLSSLITEQQITDLDINSNSRAENLSLQQFAQLSYYL